jgi:hypothetical protein
MKNIYTTLKAKSHILYCTLSAFLTPIKPLIATVGLFIIADTLVGIYKAKRLKQKITSRILRTTLVPKLIMYTGTVVLVFCLEKFVLNDFILLFTSIPFFCTKLVSAVLSYIEIKSIDESITSITGVSIWTRIKDMLSKAKGLKDDLTGLK